MGCPQVIKPASIHVHPQYKNAYSGHDIALIRLQEPAKMLITHAERAVYSRGGIMGSKTLAVPICLPWRDADPGRAIETGKGPFTYDIYIIYGTLDPPPVCFWDPIYDTDFKEPYLLHLPPPPSL